LGWQGTRSIQTTELRPFDEIKLPFNDPAEGTGNL
jgi:hypothetical protein